MNYNNCEFLASYGLSRQLPDSDRPEIVFSGRSNVGKSSLINTPRSPTPSANAGTS